MTERKPFTDTGVKALPLPEKGSKIHFDPALPGFGCRVTSNGARSYILDYRVRGSGRQRRYTIGDVGNWSIGAARRKAKELKRQVDDGGDPLGDLKAERDEPTVHDLIDRFDAEHIGPRLRPMSQRSYRMLINRYIRPHFSTHGRVIDVAFEDIDALHRKVTKLGNPYAANRIVAILSRMLSLAVHWRMRDDNPCKGVGRNYEAKRKRYLKGDELTRLIKALAAYPDQQVSNIFRLLLMTGARRGEVMSMRWAEVDLGTGVWSKPGSTTKQKTDHIVPLSAPARMLLAEIAAQQKRPLPTWVFPSNANPTGHTVTLERGWRTICRTAGIEGLRIHDLRHSFASELISSGASLALVGALLGHSNPVTTHRYAHLHDDPMRAAVERVGATISAVGKPVAPVKQFRRGR